MHGTWGSSTHPWLLPRRRYDFLQVLADYPTWTCIIAYSVGYDYDTVRSGLLRFALLSSSWSLLRLHWSAGMLPCLHM
jgi:hypothetical protein